MLHPVNRSSIRCTTSMASLLLSFRSSQDSGITPYIDVLVTDHFLQRQKIRQSPNQNAGTTFQNNNISMQCLLGEHGHLKTTTAKQ